MRTILSSLVAGALLAGSCLARGMPEKSARTVKGSDETSAGRQADVAAEIKVPVTTSFGVYKPYMVPRYKAAVGLSEATISPDFSNISVADATFPWSSFFTGAERSLLVQNGFVARPEAIGSFGQAYSMELAPHQMGSFLTVDAVLHGLRVSIDEAGRDMERNYASRVLGSQLAVLSDNISKELRAEQSPSLREALGSLLGYVQTAQSLLNPSVKTDEQVSAAVAEELRKIRGAAGMARSSVLPQLTLNYATFAPVGYYASDEKLGNYYRTRAWLSQAGFSLRTPAGSPDLASVRMASLLALMAGGDDMGSDFHQTMLNINEPSAFFNGGSGEVSSWDILTGAMRGYYGRMVDAGSNFLVDNEMLVGFVGYLDEQLPAGDGSRAAAPTFRLIDWAPQRSHAVLDRIWNDSRVSAGSYGLIAMAAMGSRHAADLRQTQAGTSRALMSAFTGMPNEAWVEDVDRAVLYTVQPLALEGSRGTGYPKFMRADAWRDREVLSALGAWGDFQHATGVMPMQAVAKATASNMGRETGVSAYVEPNPEAWGRVAALAAYIRNGLTEGRGEKLITRKLESKLQDIENVAAKMMQIAAAELAGTDLSRDQIDMLRSMPDRIAAYELFSDRSLQPEGFPVTASASTIGGVGVGTGHPLAIYVIVPQADGELMLTRGAIYSYYEMNGSTAEWNRSITASGGTVSPDMSWMNSFVSGDRAFAQDARKFRGVNAEIPAVAASYVPSQQERRAASAKAEINLESNVVSRNGGELWFTVRAPNLEGSQLVVSLANSRGQVVQHSEIGRIEKGERLDVVRIQGLSNGQYFIRVEDMGGRMIASGRFLVVR